MQDPHVKCPFLPPLTTFHRTKQCRWRRQVHKDMANTRQFGSLGPLQNLIPGWLRSQSMLTAPGRRFSTGKSPAKHTSLSLRFPN
ncbi:hypothetical protein PoB_002199700 [Plakobranchus ocellatus]|uniref:Uncharacterized protein n=1 Tax=Plakobranchus ocellatus TaxID=259542 RepID=A0AAV3ZJK5_9GAST|nr:hypothetical protein PoB_002199700 [Plakobranchus ocellatus]